ncbi:unnamed protein product [Rhizoctonia solani]|uniref:Transmembrane protein n=1 Tax=Rhizoctonia solani TaxID=456999 RepID=A0A8H3HSB6_9AGAM|nr:unnamed protein product [Rhizoctonia solani]
MPYNVTVDDISPLIKYSQTWVSYVSKPESDEHFGKTIHITQSQGAQAQFSFSGTAVYIFGARKSNYGHGIIRVDNESYDVDQYTPTQSDGTDGLYQQLLFKKENLPNRLHDVSLTYNASSGTYISLDYVMWTSGDDIIGAKNVTIDDNDLDAWRYSTDSGSWKMDSAYVGSYLYQTIHFIDADKATARVSFEGNAVYLYGGLFYDHGSFTVDIDGRRIDTLSGTANTTKTEIRAKELMYYADGLGPGIHNMTITNTPGTSDKKWLDVDYVLATQPDWFRGVDNNSKLPSLVGAVCGAVAAFILLALATWYSMRRRRRRNNSSFVDLLHENPNPYGIPMGYVPPGVGTSAYQTFYAAQHGNSDCSGTSDSTHKLIPALSATSVPSASSVNLIGSPSELPSNNMGSPGSFMPSPALAYPTTPYERPTGNAPVVSTQGAQSQFLYGDKSMLTYTG